MKGLWILGDWWINKLHLGDWWIMGVYTPPSPPPPHIYWLFEVRGLWYIRWHSIFGEGCETFETYGTALATGWWSLWNNREIPGKFWWVFQHFHVLFCLHLTCLRHHTNPVKRVTDHYTRAARGRTFSIDYYGRKGYLK